MAEAAQNKPRDRPSFWATLPGILTGIAGLVAAVAGIIAIFVGPGSSSEGPTHAEWAAGANQACLRAADSIRHMPPPIRNLSSFMLVSGPVTAEVLRDKAEELRALPAPEADGLAIDRLATVFESESNEWDYAVAVHREGGSAAIAASFYRQLEKLEREGKVVARELGVTACTQSPAIVGY
jgi:hypothetical protein